MKLSGMGSLAGTEHRGDQMDDGRLVRSLAMSSHVAVETSGSRKDARRVNCDLETMPLKQRHTRRASLRLDTGR